MFTAAMIENLTEAAGGSFSRSVRIKGSDPLCYIFCDHNVLQFQPCDAAKDRNRYCGVARPRTQEDEDNLAEM